MYKLLKTLVISVGLAQFLGALALAAPTMDSHELLEYLEKNSLRLTGFGQTCLDAMDRARANGFQSLNGHSLEELRKEMSEVEFFRMPENSHAFFEMNLGQSAFCQTKRGLRNARAYIESVDADIFSQGLLNETKSEAGLCLHEALCALGYGDQSYVTSLVLKEMAYEKNSSLVALAEQLPNLLQKDRLTPRIDQLIASKSGGSGTSVGGGGDLHSQLFKEALLAEFAVRLRKDKNSYSALAPLLADCSFDVVDISAIFSDRASLLAAPVPASGVYPVYYSQIGRVYFYIEKAKYDSLLQSFMKSRDAKVLDAMYDEIFAELRSLVAEGYSTCTNPALR